MNTAKHIAEITGLKPRHVWADVRRRGIEPRKVHGTFVLTDAQLKKYLELRESGYSLRTAPAAPKTKTQNRKRSPRKSKPEPVTAVTRKASNGKKYTYIPAPFEVPERWEWKA